jgi:hypothetical protein
MRSAMESNAKQLAGKVKKILDGLGAPIGNKERVAILSKMLGIPKPQAWSLIEGHSATDPIVLKKLAHEFELNL